MINAERLTERDKDVNGHYTRIVEDVYKFSTSALYCVRYPLDGAAQLLPLSTSQELFSYIVL